MLEYKVITSSVKNAQDNMNALAKDGWKVISVSPNIALLNGVVITFEREKQN